MSSSLAPGDDGVDGVADLSLQGETGRRVSSLARHHARLKGARLPAYQHAIPRGTQRGWPALSPRLGTLARARCSRHTIQWARLLTGVAVPVVGGVKQVHLPQTKRVLALVISLAALSLIVLVSLSVRASSSQLTGAIDPALQPHFDAVWERADLAVLLGEAQRGWTWGPAPISTTREPYAQTATGERLVQYYDKGRLEINDPANPSGVTTGLLVRELVSGQLALGDDPAEAETREPAHIAVAGDPLALNPAAPTYASFHHVASLAVDRPAQDVTGTPVTQTIDQHGTVGQLPASAQAGDDDTTITAFEPTLKHNIPKAFWRFLHRKDVVYEHGQSRHYQPVYEPWQTITGLPITEPYWISTNVAGTPQWILVQLFERRVLTYTPGNSPPHQVEMGNTGLHYVEWRYGSMPGPPTLRAEEASLTPTSAEISWSATTPLQSEVHFGTSSTTLNRLAATQEHVLSSTATLAALAPGERYVWRVVGQDQRGRILRSPLFSLRTPNPNARPICLTFDDGPIAGTETVLDVLDGRVPATFFMTGANMASHPDQQAALVLRMLREGHQLANHTFSHVPMFIPDYQQTYSNLSDSAAIERFRENYAHNEGHFRDLLDAEEPFFRLARLPGAGQAIETGGKRIYVDATNEMGLVHVGWNVELAPNGRFGHVHTMNWLGIQGIAATSPDPPVAHDILLLHDSHFHGRGELLAAVIETLARNGFSFGWLDQHGSCVAR